MYLTEAHLSALYEGLLAHPVHLLGGLLGPRRGAVDDCVDAHEGGWQGRGVPQIRLHCGGPPVAQKVCGILPRPHDAAHLHQTAYSRGSLEMESEELARSDDMEYVMT